MADMERDIRDAAADRPAGSSCHQTGEQPGKPAKGLGGWLMLLCCIVPVLLAAGPLFGGTIGLATLGRSGGSLLILLLCPLMHLFMMRGMGHGDHK